MAKFRGLSMPPAMVTQMKNVMVKKTVDLTSFLDRGNVSDAVVPEDSQGAGWRKDQSGKGSSGVGNSVSMGSITDTQIIEDHDFGTIGVEVTQSNKKSFKQRRAENRAFARGRGGNS